MKAPFSTLRKAKSTTLLLRVAYSSILAVELLTLVCDNVPITFQLMVCALGSIVIGSYSSLIDSHEVEALAVERLKPKDAYMFPVLGSVTLCVAYFVIKYAPRFIIDILVRCVFVVIGTAAIESLLDSVWPLLLSKGCKVSASALMRVTVYCVRLPAIGPLPQLEVPWIAIAMFPKALSADSRKDNDSKKGSSTAANLTVAESSSTVVTYVNALNLALGFVASVLWFRTEHYILNNLIGISVCIQAISFINPGSYFTAFMLLCLLFFYDIFWVFGTEVMVTVAKGINAPIKLLFVRASVQSKASMLGLGDIVLPGIYIALLLRWDVVRTFDQKATAKAATALKTTDIREVYFWTAMFGYILAMGVCLTVMYAFSHAQPALLYLVPGVIFPVLALAICRGELGALWAFDEEPEAEETEQGKKDK